MVNPLQEFMVINGISREEKNEDFPLAMAYIRRQKVLDTLPAAEGFSCGTIFRELYKPFMGEMQK